MANFQFQSGDVILTHNTDEVGNDSPGFWNHAAIACEWFIIEAQDTLGIAAFRFDNFEARYPEFLVLRHKDRELAHRVGNEAIKYIGGYYNKFASAMPKLKSYLFGDNCVSLIRRAFGIDKCVIPDDILKNPDFVEVYHHKDYTKWVRPATWFGGRIA
jgi:hypothetical protein